MAEWVIRHWQYDLIEDRGRFVLFLSYHGMYSTLYSYNLQTAKLNNLNFHPLLVVCGCRDPQLQEGENYTLS